MLFRRYGDRWRTNTADVSEGVAAVARAADKASEVVSTERSAETLAENLAENLTAMLVRTVATAVTEDHIAGVRWH